MYRAALFAPDGDYVTDYDAPTIEGVIDRVANGGSRWYFYPIAVVIRARGPQLRGTISLVSTPNSRIVDAPEPFADFRGRTLHTFGRFLADHPGLVAAVLGA